MKRILGWGAGVVVAALGLVAVYAYQKFTRLDVVRVTDDVHMIEGAGGNIGVLRTEKGAVVVDTMSLRLQGEGIRKIAERLAGGPTQAILNTHYHVDHTHGNPGFAPNARVVATRRSLEHLLALDAGYWEGEAAKTLPNVLFDDTHVMQIGGKTIESHHLGRGHTDGDLVVIFVEDRVIHTGDLFFHDFYPNIDLEAGGSLAAWIETLDRVLALEFDTVIPGHGPVADRQGIVAFQAFLRELWGVGQEAARQGRSLDETVAGARLTRDSGFGVIGIPLAFRLDRDFVVRRAWEEATGSFALHDAPDS